MPHHLCFGKSLRRSVSQAIDSANNRYKRNRDDVFVNANAVVIALLGDNFNQGDRLSLTAAAERSLPIVTYLYFA